MTEQEILNLIEQDQWMMSVIEKAASLNLPQWVIGAGFVRNKVWDQLHGYSKKKVDTNDIDLVYFDPLGNNEEADQKLSEELKSSTGLLWEVVNEAYAHKWNNLMPYVSTEDAISRWPETATAIGVTSKDGKLKFIAPYGIDDLVNMIIRPSSRFDGGKERVRERTKQKRWLEQWPKLRIAE